MDAPARLPVLLRFGLILTAFKALFFLYAYTCGGVLLGVGFGVAGAWAEPRLRGSTLALGSLLGVLASVAVAFEILTLFVCWGARKGGRLALWALILVSALAFVDAGPLGMGVGLVTIVGAALALEGRTPVPGGRS